MIRTLQKKFVVTAMVAVSVLLLVVLGALNVFNLASNRKQLDTLLEALCRQKSIPSFAVALPGDPTMQQPNGTFPALREEGISGRDKRRWFWDEPIDENARLSALYFTVDLDDACQVLRTDVTHIASVSESDAAKMALNLDVDRATGNVGEYRYRILPVPEGGYKVVFLSSTSRRTAVMRVALLSVLLGSVSWLLMLALVIALSRRAIRPIAENMERQRQFVTDAGHELKTPVAIILANVDAMELRTGENKYSRNIRAQTGRLSNLVQNLLTLARVDEYSVLEHAELLDFTALCAELFGAFQEPAELKGICYRTELTEPVSLWGDRTLLSQLCSILADNAVKYCAPGGEISVRLSLDGSRPLLSVSNTVEEVPDLTRIFDRFYRSDPSRNQKTGGFGIGLSSAQAIARLHRAQLEADYDKKTSALRFSVRFPAS